MNPEGMLLSDNLKSLFGSYPEDLAPRGPTFLKDFALFLWGDRFCSRVINYEANSLEYPELITEGNLVENVRKVEDTITKKECIVDGTRDHGPTSRV